MGEIDGRSVGIRNPITWRDRLSRWRGRAILRDLGRYVQAVDEIGGSERRVGGLSDTQLTREAEIARDALRAGTSRTAVRNRVFAIVREIARRTLGERPFDEQVVAALAMDDGAIVEMQTGEGKTLAGVMPAALHGLAGHGVHVLTFNDYLASRDARWMAPIYRRLGLTVAFIEPGMSRDVRREAYRADVTYTTAREAGFDHLRDLRALTAARVVHRGFAFALVDEADSLLIDEARVPLVIAGAESDPSTAAAEAAALVENLIPGVHFDTDDYARDVGLTEAGITEIERLSGCRDLHHTQDLELLARVNCALHARVLLCRDVDYIVRDGRIEHVDDCTGRVVRDRQWPDGLQAALEAKEGLAVRAGGRVLGSMTLARFLRGYRHLCGMTGTASDAAEELRATYGTPVLVIPTHRPVCRIDRPDIVFATREAKEQAVVREIGDAHRSGRPVLVGTRTVAESERLAGELAAGGIRCEVLNARHDAREAAIVAEAGRVGAVTVATNMAGRGTDIRLGGGDERDRARVVALGGLYVIGTNRHESRRVDRQLRGRAGRQGDPGESCFFISLEDDLLVRYGLERLLSNRLPPAPPDEPLAHPLVAREVARAQRIIEGQDFEIRRTLARYSAVIEDQYAALVARRQAILHGDVAGVWPHDDPRRIALVAATDESSVEAAERTIVLHHLDRRWSDHLAFCADLREGIHLVRLGGQDPLTRLTSEAILAFQRVEEEVEAATLETLARVRAVDGGVDVSAVDLTTPAATWTYLVNDDPFKDQMGTLVMGPGGRTIAIYGAAMLMPLLLAWGLIARWLRRSPQRRTPGSTSRGLSRPG
jgi:preprotein translocase subunit SecA